MPTKPKEKSAATTEAPQEDGDRIGWTDDDGVWHDGLKPLPADEKDREATPEEDARSEALMTAPHGEVEWEDPPTSNRTGRRNGSPLAQFVQKLKNNPGRWAVYKRDATSSGSYTKTYPGTEWTSRKNVDGDHAGLITVYGRWTGED
jgi:hypothetical protein